MEEKIDKTSNTYIDLTERKFGRLTVIKFLYNRNNQSHWLCKCVCGRESAPSKGKLLSGRTTSCGCFRREITVQRSSTHGMSKTRFYHIWGGIKERCYNKLSPAYSFYGERGISMSKKWQKFEGFKEDMYASYLSHLREFGENNTSIERINNNGNYELENCVWATDLLQGGNRRTNKYFKAISPDGVEYISKNKTAFGREHGLVSVSNISKCVSKKLASYKGWKFYNLENYNES